MNILGLISQLIIIETLRLTGWLIVKKDEGPKLKYDYMFGKKESCSTMH